jgi:ankyrin repeat protein
MERELIDAIAAGDLIRGRLLVQGGANITGAVHHAMRLKKILIVEWLLAEGGANISEVDDTGHTVLLSAANPANY